MLKTEAHFRAMEQNVVLRFSHAFNARFVTNPPIGSIIGWANTALGAQDEIFADHLLAANARFALIEFKASFFAIRTEAKKPLREKLFKSLALHNDVLRRCLDFHFVCWGTIHQHASPGASVPIEEEIDYLNHYAVHVAPYMKTALRLRPVADLTTEEFLDRFLGSRMVGGTVERFRQYVDELGKLAEGGQEDASSIEGMVYVYLPRNDQSPARYAGVRFRGIKQLELLLNPKVKEKTYEVEYSRGRSRKLRADPDFDHDM